MKCTESKVIRLELEDSDTSADLMRQLGFWRDDLKIRIDNGALELYVPYL